MKITFGDHALDVDRRELNRGGERIALAPQVFDLLVYLVRNREHVVTKDDLIEAVWDGRIVSASALTTRINAVRRVIGDSGAEQRLIRTVPRRGIRFIGEVREEAQPPGATHTESPAGTEPTSVVLPDKPSIAVLPFQNMSGDSEQDYFADGTVEEIITALSRIRWLSVIARNSSFTYKGQAVDVRQVGRELGVRYVLEGSVRKAGRQLRITAQLSEAWTGASLWADRFDRSLEDVLEFQDKVALSVAGAIEPRLEAAEIHRSVKRSTSNLTAYDLYLRALPNALSFKKDAAIQAIDLLGRAIECDPRYGRALALAAWWRLQLGVNGWTDEQAVNRHKAIDLARQALQVGGDDPGVLADAAGVLEGFGEDIDFAVALIDRALVLNPSSAIAWHWSGWIRLSASQPDLAIEHFGTSLRLDPLALGLMPFHLTGVGIAHLFRRRFEEAASLLLASLQQLPSYVTTYRFLASCYVHMGRLNEARQIVKQLRAITPTVVPTATHWRNPEDRELYLQGLRLAAGAAA
jgi:TolB-like protein